MGVLYIPYIWLYNLGSIAQSCGECTQLGFVSSPFGKTKFAKRAEGKRRDAAAIAEGLSVVSTKSSLLVKVLSQASRCTTNLV